MFGLFKKKTQLQQLIAKDGMEHVTERFAEIISRKLLTPEIAYEFICEELDGASQGNEASMRFAESSGIASTAYRGALSNSNPQIDGPDGPQQLLLALTLDLAGDQALMAQFRCKVDDKVMRRFGLGRYAKSSAAPPVADQASQSPNTLAEARAAYKSHDFDGAMVKFRPLALGGEAEAQYYLGLMFHKGRGVEQDYVEAARWYRLAAENGYSLAQTNLSDLYHVSVELLLQSLE